MNDFFEDKIYEFTSKILYTKYMSKPNFKKITKIKLNFNDSIENLSYPEKLLVLIFGDNFDNKLGHVNITKSEPIVDDDYNVIQSGSTTITTKSYLPTTITYLSFGTSFNQPLGEQISTRPLEIFSFLPNSLRTLILLNTEYNQYLVKSEKKLEKSFLPNSLKILKLSSIQGKHILCYNKYDPPDNVHPQLNSLELSQCQEVHLDDDIISKLFSNMNVENIKYKI